MHVSKVKKALASASAPSSPYIVSFCQLESSATTFARAASSDSNALNSGSFVVWSSDSPYTFSAVVSRASTMARDQHARI